MLTSMLKSLGHVIEEATDDRLAVKLMELKTIGLVLGEVDPLDANALELLTYIRRNHRGIPSSSYSRGRTPKGPGRRYGQALRASSTIRFPPPRFRAAVLQGLESSDVRAFRSVRVAPPPTPLPATALVPSLSSSTADHLEFEDVFTPDSARTVGPSADFLGPSAWTFNSSVVDGSAIAAMPPSPVFPAELLAQKIGLLGTDPG